MVDNEYDESKEDPVKLGWKSMPKYVILKINEVETRAERYVSGCVDTSDIISLVHGSSHRHPTDHVLENDEKG